MWHKLQRAFTELLLFRLQPESERKVPVKWGKTRKEDWEKFLRLIRRFTEALEHFPIAWGYLGNVLKTYFDARAEGTAFDNARKAARAAAERILGKITDEETRCGFFHWCNDTRWEMLPSYYFPEDILCHARNFQSLCGREESTDEDFLVFQQYDRQAQSLVELTRRISFPGTVMILANAEAPIAKVLVAQYFPHIRFHGYEPWNDLAGVTEWVRTAAEAVTEFLQTKCEEHDFPNSHSAGGSTNYLDPTTAISAADSTAIRFPQFSSKYIFRPDPIEDGRFHICFENEEGRFDAIEGLHLIHQLLKDPNPTKPKTAVQLRNGCEDGKYAEKSHSRNQILSVQQLKDVRTRMQELRASGEISGVEEADQLESLIKSMVWNPDNFLSKGYEPKPKNLGTSIETKARTALRKNFTAACEKLEGKMPKLVQHLRRTMHPPHGKDWAYRPDHPICWQLDCTFRKNL